MEHFAEQFKGGARCAQVQKRVVAPLDPGANYGKMRVGELKAILAQRGVPCQLCVEKADFVRKARKRGRMCAGFRVIFFAWESDAAQRTEGSG